MKVRTMRTFTDAAAILAEYCDTGNPRAQRYTLERMQALLQACGNPQNSLSVIHVAGTSGKTSTAYYAAALVQANGLKTGLTVSPHVVDMNDRVQLNGVPLPEPLFCSELQTFLEIVASADLHPSYFELMLAFAFWEFARQQVDCAVVEVGLGGLLDPSNTIDREDKICVITDIGLDHTQVLGNTLGEIAAQKAGIIQLHNTVFCYRQSAEVMQAFHRQAQQMQADLHILSPDERALETHDLPLFQQRNYSLAAAVATEFCRRRHRQLTAKARQQAVQTSIPGRMETKRHGDKVVIIDGAHNQQKMTALADSIAKKYPRQPLAALVAFGNQAEAEQRVRESLAVLQPHVSRLLITTFNDPKDAPHVGVEPDKVAAVARELGFQDICTEVDPKKAFTKLLDVPEPIALVTGSFYLLNHIRPLLFDRQ